MAGSEEPDTETKPNLTNEPGKSGLGETSTSKAEPSNDNLSSQRVFKKSSPNNKLTLYLSSRDLVVTEERIDKLQGVLLIDPEYVDNKKVYGQVTLTFRYGREDEEVMGLKFCNEAVMCLAQLYPPHPSSTLAQQHHGNTPLQDALMKRLGPNAYPFTMEITPLAPPSVQLVPAKEYNGAPIGTSYDVRAYVADRPDEKLQRKTTVRMGIRVVQRATAPPSPYNYNPSQLAQQSDKEKDSKAIIKNQQQSSQRNPHVGRISTFFGRSCNKANEDNNEKNGRNEDRKTKNGCKSSADIEKSKAMFKKDRFEDVIQNEEANTTSIESCEKTISTHSDQPQKLSPSPKVPILQRQHHLMNGIEEFIDDDVNDENEEPKQEPSPITTTGATNSANVITTTNISGGSVQSTPAKRCSEPASEQICSDNESSQMEHIRTENPVQLRRASCFFRDIPAPRAAVDKPFLLSDGRITLEASLNKAIYSHGEPVQVHISVSNNSSKTVRRIKVFVVQHVDVCMFSNGKFKNVVAIINSKDDCPIGPGGSLTKTYNLSPTKGSTKNWIALEDSYSKSGTSLASTVTCNSNNPEDRNVFAIYVSYYVKVKLLVSVMGGELSLKLPFTLMHTCPEFDPQGTLTKCQMESNLKLDLKPNLTDETNTEYEVKPEKDGT